MTVALLLMPVAPLYFAVFAILGNLDQIAGWSKSLANLTLTRPPDWVREIPWVGTSIESDWQHFVGAESEQISSYLAPFARTAGLWFLSKVGNLGLLLAQFLLTVIIAAILYARGEAAARGVEIFAQRLIGPEGVKAVNLATQAVRSVALGVVVTAVVQSVLAGLGLVFAGVPFAMLLTALMFVLAVAQIGPAPALIGAIAWTYFRSGVRWGTALPLWSIFCVTFDNALRPLLIKPGADLPLLVIFAGVNRWTHRFRSNWVVHRSCGARSDLYFAGRLGI